MEVISSGEGRELTLTLRGELDHHAAKEAMRKLEWELDAALPSKLTLDFSGVTFMDSSGVGLILGRGRHISALGGRLTVQNPPPAVRRMLDLARITYA
ncbi:STAS domain-containing protein [bacterium]|nr:STAS domain-containing protein [bacterium]